MGILLFFLKIIFFIVIILAYKEVKKICKDGAPYSASNLRFFSWIIIAESVIMLCILLWNIVIVLRGSITLKEPVWAFMVEFAIELLYFCTGRFTLLALKGNENAVLRAKYCFYGIFTYYVLIVLAYIGMIIYGVNVISNLK